MEANGGQGRCKKEGANGDGKVAGQEPENALEKATQGPVPFWNELQPSGTEGLCDQVDSCHRSEGKLKTGAGNGVRTGKKNQQKGGG